MNNVNNSIFHRFYQGFVNSPMIETLSSSQLYQTVKERFADFSTQIHVDQIFSKFGIDPDWAHQNGCPLHETVQKPHVEIPKMLPENTLACLSSDEQLAFFENTVITPITEQALFQGFIQDVLLTRLPRSTRPLYRRDEPDGTLTKVARAVVTAGAYAGYKAFGASCEGEMMDTQRLALSFAEGLVYSVIKETDLGIMGSAVAQIGLQALSHYPPLSVCAAPSSSSPGGYPQIG